jgi:hypothetical protein
MTEESYFLATETKKNGIDLCFDRGCILPHLKNRKTPLVLTAQTE